MRLRDEHFIRSTVFQMSVYNYSLDEDVRENSMFIFIEINLAHGIR